MNTPVGTIMVSIFSIIMGIQFILAFLQYDISTVPKKQETDFLMGSCIFLFAHQDDEVGISCSNKKKIDQGANVICVFATNGGKNLYLEIRSLCLF